MSSRKRKVTAAHRKQLLKSLEKARARKRHNRDVDVLNTLNGPRVGEHFADLHALHLRVPATTVELKVGNEATVNGVRVRAVA